MITHIMGSYHHLSLGLYVPTIKWTKHVYLLYRNQLQSLFIYLSSHHRRQTKTTPSTQMLAQDSCDQSYLRNSNNVPNPQLWLPSYRS